MKSARALATAGAAILALGPSPAKAQAPDDGTRAVTVFGARMADNNWHELLTLEDVSFRDAWLAGAGLSVQLAGTGDWALELEGQTVRHFGEQDHWEINGVLLGRWRAFPWSQRLPTSFAFGIGPSLATDVPAAEVARDGDSAELLLYWTAEIEVGLPESPWSAITRLHHRSTAYGLFADEGGSNWVTLGIRRRF